MGMSTILLAIVLAIVVVVGLGLYVVRGWLWSKETDEADRVETRRAPDREPGEERPEQARPVSKTQERTRFVGAPASGGRKG